MTMKDSNVVTDDSICGITVAEATALHAERDGGTFCATSRARWSARRRTT